jgi:hypothetical protein
VKNEGKESTARNIPLPDGIKSKATATRWLEEIRLVAPDIPSPVSSLAPIRVTGGLFTYFYQIN